MNLSVSKFIPVPAARAFNSAMQSSSGTSFNSAAQALNKDKDHHHSKHKRAPGNHSQPQELSGMDFFKILNMNSKKKRNNSKK